MSYPETIQSVIDRTIQQFGAVSNVTAVDPIEEMTIQAAVGIATDFLPAVAGHLYFLERLHIIQVQAITGTPQVRGYDLTPTAHSIAGPNINTASVFDMGGFWVTRLEHFPAGATVGFYSVIYYGFDLTYT